MPRPRALSSQTRLVLSTLLEAGCRGAYGYEIGQAISIKSGTLYPILMRLSAQGFMEAEWREPEVTGRPPRQVYRLTASGVELARRNPPESQALGPPAPAGAPA